MPEAVKLFNTMGREIQELTPLEADKLGVYCCGPCGVVPSSGCRFSLWLFVSVTVFHDSLCLCFMHRMLVHVQTVLPRS